MSKQGRLAVASERIGGEFGEIVRIPDLRRYWFGQLVSDLGSQATMFVLMAVVYIETGSLTQFALLFAIESLPDIVLSPVAGVLVDKYDRRTLHVIGDGGAAIVTAAALGLWSIDSLTVPAIYGLMIVASTFGVLQGAAQEAMYQQIVPPKKMVRVGAVFGPADELVEAVAPAIGAILLAVAGAGAVFAVDLVTFSFGLWTLFTLSHPEKFRSHIGRSDETDDDDDDDEELSSIQFFLEGWRYYRREPGMAFLFFYEVVDEFLSNVLLLMAAAAALELGGEATLASVQGASGIGALVGMALIAFFGLRRRRVITRNVVMNGLIIGLFLLIVPFSSTTTTLVIAAFIYMLMSAPVDAALEATYLATVPKHLIGRASAVADSVSGLANLYLLLVVAPIVDFGLGPAIAEDGLDLGPLGTIGGNGDQLAVLLLVIGLAGAGMVLLNLWALVSRHRASADELARAVETTPVFSQPDSSAAAGDDAAPKAPKEPRL